MSNTMPIGGHDLGGIDPRGVMGSTEPDAIYTGRLALNGREAGGKINYSGPLHLVLFGPNGAGKSTRLLVPNLLSIKGRSIVVIDPKGQLAAITAKYRHETIGDDVKIIDPFGVLAEEVRKDPYPYRYLTQHGLIESAGFNPLAALNPGLPSFYDDAKVIAEALIKIQGNDPHWSESAQGLVTGLIMWEKKRNGKDANLENVRFMLTEADTWERTFDPEAGRYVEGLVSGLSVTAAQMVAEGGYEIASLAARFKKETPTKEMESVRSAAETQTEWLLSPLMRADLKKGGVDFSKLKSGDRPMTVYVILPSKYLESHSIWLRLVVSEALRASLTAGGRRVLLMLDEFGALGHLSMIERLWAVTRDYRVQMWPVFQDLPQLKELYSERWETILGMAGVVQSFRASGLTTAEWLSKRGGGDTAMALGHNQGSGHSAGGSNTNTGLSRQQIAVPFIRPEDTFGLPDGYMLGWFAGQRYPTPMCAEKYARNTLLNARALPDPYHKD